MDRGTAVFVRGRIADLRFTLIGCRVPAGKVRTGYKGQAAPSHRNRYDEVAEKCLTALELVSVRIWLRSNESTSYPTPGQQSFGHSSSRMGKTSPCALAPMSPSPPAS